MTRLLNASLWILIASSAAYAAEPVVDNERVTVWDTEQALPPAAHDFVAVSLTKPGTARYGHKGEVPAKTGEHTIVVELKDTKVAPLPNPGSDPLSFPRPHAEKLFENERVVVWHTRWLPNEPSPRHFHDKDTLVVFEGNGTLKSTTPDGKTEDSTVHFGQPRYAKMGRTHSELLMSGDVSAVITELK